MANNTSFTPSAAVRTGSGCNFRLFNDTEIWLQVTSYLLIILFSSFGNTVIISIVKKNRRMRSPTNYFIVNLCLANLMIMLMNVVHYVVGRISPHKGYGISGRYLYISVWTRVRPPLFSSNINSLLSSNWANWDNREMVWKDAEAIFQWESWTLPLSDRKVPMTSAATWNISVK